MQNDDPFAYSGTDNLEVMAEAENYNAYLASLVARHTAGARRVVDFGAGIGTFAWPLHAAGRELIAVEPDAGQRAHMAARGIRCADDIARVDDGWADALYTMNVLEHIEDDAAALRALFAKVRPGGTLFIYVPAFQLLYSAMDRKVGHFRRYRRSELVAKVAGAGFRVVDARYADSLGFFATLAYRWLGSGTGDINRRSLRLYDRVVFPLSRILDVLASPFFGKNLRLVAVRPEAAG